MDITTVILDQHHEQRRMFAYLDEIPRDDVETLGAVWKRLESCSRPMPRRRSDTSTRA